MLLKWSSGPVASWTFEDRSRRIVHADRAAAQELVDLCEAVARIVEEFELLHPQEAVLGWIARETVAPPTVLRLEGAETIRSSCRAAFDQHECGQEFPGVTSIEVFGNGTAIDEVGKRRTVTDLTWLHATTLLHHSVSLSTRADVWLPYTLDGRPQAKTAEYNAPRLESALRAVADRLHLAARPSETSYAFNGGYRLHNLTDQDGCVIDVTYGRDLVEPEEREDP